MNIEVLGSLVPQCCALWAAEKEMVLGAGELAPWLRIFAILGKDPSSGPDTHMRAYNCL